MSAARVGADSDRAVALFCLAGADLGERLEVDDGHGDAEERFHEREGAFREAPPGRVRGIEEKGAKLLVLEFGPAEQAGAAARNVAGQELRRNER